VADFRIQPRQSENVIPPHTYTYKHTDHVDVQADVYAPDSARRSPVVLWIHGGCLIMGHRSNIASWQRDLYLEAGFAVVSIDYRLAPETKLPAIIDDLEDACRWVRKSGPQLFHADPDRIAVIGHSAGGYLALMSGFRADPRPAAVVAFYGYGDIVGPWYSEPSPFYLQQPRVPVERARATVGGGLPTGTQGADDRDDFYLYCRQNGLWPYEVSGHHPKSEPDFFRPYCPVRNVDSEYPPTLLLHGDRDTDVPYEQSVMMAEALAAAGVEHDLITIDGGEHGFDAQPSPEARRALRRVLDFLKIHLRQR
jgi:acetyl esterase/lipase